MSQLTRDYKGAGRRPAQMSGMKEFGLGVLAGALLAGGGAVLIAAHVRHGQRGAAGSVCAARSGSLMRDSGRSSAPARSMPTPTPASQPPALAQGGAAAARGQAPATRKQVPAPAPQYDFYQMLPKLTVPVAGGGTPARGSTHAAKAPAEYLLQVGSYSSDAQARRLRERLAHLGVTARIERITQNGRAFNRVRIGPVDAAQSARIRSELAPAGIHPLVIPAP